MKVVRELEKLGFSLWLDGDNIKYHFQGESKPEQATIKPLLDVLKARKPEAVRYLQGRPVDPRCEGKKARALLNKQGWCAVKSQALGGEIVIWANDGKVIIPARWQGNVLYSMDEIAALAADGGVTEEGLRRVHEAKRIFGGTVCGAKEP